MNDWNPLASVEEVEVPLDVSGGRATVKFAAWGGRERIAYDDALVTRCIVNDDAGEETVLLATMHLIRTALTVRGATGFPPREDGSAMFTLRAGDRSLAESVERDLLALDLDTFVEIRDKAREVEPLADLGGGDDGDEDEEAGLPDPSRASSTPPTPIGETEPDEESPAGSTTLHAPTPTDES